MSSNNNNNNTSDNSNNNNNNWNNNHNGRENNNNNNFSGRENRKKETETVVVTPITRKIRATEILGYNIFNCISRKNIKVCVETFKQIVIYIGKEYGRNTDNIKYVVEHLENPYLEKPKNINKENQKNNIKIFKWKKQIIFWQRRKFN